MALEKLFHVRKTEKKFLELHLIADSSRTLGVVLQKLKTFFGQVRVETTGNAETVVSGIHTSHLFLGRCQPHYAKQSRVVQGMSHEFFKGVGDGFGCSFDCLILCAGENVWPEGRTGGPVALQQAEVVLRY